MPAELKHLIERAKGGDESTLPALREWLDQDSRAWELTGNPAYQTQMSMIKAASDTGLAVEEMIHRKVSDLQQELAGPSPSPLERLLVERITTCWLHLYCVECIYVQKQSKLTLPQGEYYQRRINHAHCRYLSAIQSQVAFTNFEASSILTSDIRFKTCPSALYINLKPICGLRPAWFVPLPTPRRNRYTLKL